MNIGDKVRVISGTEEGIVTDFLPNDMVQIEIEEGFDIPVLKKDLVVVSASEKDHFSRKNPETSTSINKSTSPEQRVYIEKGIFVSYVAIGINHYELSLINTTEYQLVYRVMEYHDSNYKGIKAGLLNHKGHVKLGTKMTQDFDRWPVLVIDINYFLEGFFEAPEQMHKRVKPKATIFKNKVKIPLLAKEGYIIQIDQHETKIDAVAIKEKIEQNIGANESTKEFPEKGGTSIDLHAEIQGLIDDETGSILDKQVGLFEQFIDTAILQGNQEVEIIHGVGNGVLRNHIHGALSRHPHIAYYKDANKGKFGYGSTIAKIK